MGNSKRHGIHREGSGIGSLEVLACSKCSKKQNVLRCNFWDEMWDKRSKFVAGEEAWVNMSWSGNENVRKEVGRPRWYLRNIYEQILEIWSLWIM